MFGLNRKHGTSSITAALPQLFVGNLAYSIDEAGLRLLFAPYGPVVRAKIIRERREPFISKGAPESQHRSMVVFKLLGFLSGNRPYMCRRM